MLGRSSTRKKSLLVDFTIDLLEQHRNNNFDSRKANGLMMTFSRLHQKEFDRIKIKDIKRIRIGDLLD